MFNFRLIPRKKTEDRLEILQRSVPNDKRSASLGRRKQRSDENVQNSISPGQLLYSKEQDTDQEDSTLEDLVSVEVPGVSPKKQTSQPVENTGDEEPSSGEVNITDEDSNSDAIKTTDEDSNSDAVNTTDEDSNSDAVNTTDEDSNSGAVNTTDEDSSSGSFI